MANIVTVYPANGAQGVFLSETIYIDFDELMDHASINRGTFVVTGPEHTLFSGPDTLRWIDLLENEELFDSPGFEGFMAGNISFEVLGGGSETYRTRAIFTPSTTLAPNTTFKVYLFGDQGQHLGQNYVQSRSVGDVGTVVQTGSGELTISGCYHGIEDAINVEITTGGERGDAYMRWWFDTSPGTVTEKLVRREIQISSELTLNFATGTYEKDDRWRIPLYASTPVDSVYQWTFTTGSQKMITPPDVESEEVSSGGGLPSQFADSPFVDGLGTFANSTYGVSPDTTHIDIYINKVLDLATVLAENNVRMLYQSLNFPFEEGSIPIVVEAAIVGNHTRVRIKF